MKQFSFLSILTALLVFSSCKKEDDSQQDMSVIMLNVSYGNNAQQKMDVYLPATRSTTATKVMIMIHGGGWNTGDKTDFNEYVDSLKKREPTYAIFNINYRLATPTSNLFPSQENDVKAAVNFITTHAEEFEINKNKLVLVGASAGAHLALLQAYKNTEPKIKAVVDFFGPTDLMIMYNHPWHSMIPYLLKMLTGTTPSANANLYKQ